jgi:hypothetical protein
MKTKKPKSKKVRTSKSKVTMKWVPPPDVLAMLQDLARTSGKTPSQVVEDIIEEAYERFKEGKE